MRARRARRATRATRARRGVAYAVRLERRTEQLDNRQLSVIKDSRHALALVCSPVVYKQLADVKRFCGADAPDNIRSVLCVDRTVNVSSLFLTLTVFKHMSVVRNANRQPPIFLGPMFLHGDGSFVTYLQFFMTLRGALDTDVQATEVQTLDGIITGSDEEAALVKALRVAFPRSKQLYCVLHCRDNV